MSDWDRPSHRAQRRLRAAPLPPWTAYSAVGRGAAGGEGEGVSRRGRGGETVPLYRESLSPTRTSPISAPIAEESPDAFSWQGARGAGS